MDTPSVLLAVRSALRKGIRRCTVNTDTCDHGIHGRSGQPAKPMAVLGSRAEIARSRMAVFQSAPPCHSAGTENLRAGRTVVSLPSPYRCFRAGSAPEAGQGYSRSAIWRLGARFLLTGAVSRAGPWPAGAAGRRRGAVAGAGHRGLPGPRRLPAGVGHVIKVGQPGRHAGGRSGPASARVSRKPAWRAAACAVRQAAGVHPSRTSWMIACGQLVSGVIAPVTVSVIPAEVSWAAIGW